jgi:hypothetical protein
MAEGSFFFFFFAVRGLIYFKVREYPVTCGIVFKQCWTTYIEMMRSVIWDRHLSEEK